MNESEGRVLAAIRRIVHAVDSHSKELGRALGITLPQLVVLRAIRTLGEVTTGRLFVLNPVMLINRDNSYGDIAIYELEPNKQGTSLNRRK